MTRGRKCQVLTSTLRQALTQRTCFQRAISGTMRVSQGADETESDAASIPLATLRESIRKYALREIAPHADEFDRAGCLPASLWRSLGTVGALGVAAPTAHGGLGLGHEAHCMLVRELSRASASVGLAYAAHSNLCMRQIAMHGSPQQLARWMDGLVDGTLVGALAMSEAGAGSDVVGMQSRAMRDAGRGMWTLNGTKMWITNGPIADVFVVYAKTPAQENGGDNGVTGKGMVGMWNKGMSGGGGERSKDRITAFVLEKGMKGFSTAQKLDKLGMRGSETCELVFEDVQVPDENVLGGVGRGVYVLMAGLDSERLVLSAGPLGIMDACLDVVLPYVRERRQFGQPIGEFQLLQGKLADMYTGLRAAESLVERTARELDADAALSSSSSSWSSSSSSLSSSSPPPSSSATIGRRRRDCAAAILFAAEGATRAALDAVQMLGGNGYINDYPAGRLLRDAKLYEIGAGTSEIRRLLIGRELFRDESLPG
jgi:isovaleryl-CoA dehydrogenase